MPKQKRTMLLALALLSIFCAIMACSWDVPPPAFLVSPTPTKPPPTPTVTNTPINPFNNLSPQQEDCLRKSLTDRSYELLRTQQRKATRADFYALLACIDPRRTPPPPLRK